MTGPDLKDVSFPHLVPPSPIAMELMRVLCAEERHRHDVAKLIRQDPATVAALLRQASSAGVARGRTAITVDVAVARLGEDAVRRIVVNQALTAMKIQTIGGYGLDDYEHWRTALVCGHAAERIASCAGLDSGVMYIVGMLLDVGKAAIGDRMPSDRWMREGVRPDRVEVEIAGLDHAEAGFIVVKRWDLWEPIPTCIRYHHRPSDAPEHQAEVACAHLASWVAQWLGVPAGFDGMAYGLDQKALAVLGLTNLSLEDVATAVLDGIQTE